MEYKAIEPKCACCGKEGYPHTSDNGKDYCYKIHDGSKGIRVYKETGAEWDEAIGRLVKPMITRANAVQLQEKSVEKRYENRERAIIEAVEEASGLSGLNIDEADGLMGKVIARDIVLNGGAHETARVSGYKTLLQAANRWPDRAREMPNNVTINVIGGEQAARLRGIVGLQVIDAEFSESE